MTQHYSNAAPVTGDAGDRGVPVTGSFQAPSFEGPGLQGTGYQGQSHRRGLRGALALGFLLLSAAMSYGIVFVLLDKWYKGGTLGIL